MLRWITLFALTLLPASAIAMTGHGLSAKFAPCGSSKRVTCIVDGDTFWLNGIKIRVADINTPETSRPSCDAERALGQRATLRMTELLNRAPFALVRGARDEDRYGRKLRVVQRGGVSLGDQLIREGLAEPWTGRRRNWC